MDEAPSRASTEASTAGAPSVPAATPAPLRNAGATAFAAVDGETKLAGGDTDFSGYDPAAGGGVVHWPNLPDIKKRVAELDPEDVSSLADTTNPAPVVVAVGVALCTLVGQEPTWPLAKHIMSSSRFFEAMSRLKPERLTEERRDTIKKLLLKENVLWQAYDSKNDACWTLAQFLAVLTGMEKMPMRPMPKLSPRSAELVVLREKLAAAKVRQDVNMFVMAAARRDVAMLSRDHLGDIFRPENREDDLVLLVGLICLFFDLQPSWRNAKNLFSKKFFRLFLLGMSPEDVPARNFMVAKNLCRDRKLSELGRKHRLFAARTLANWACAITGGHDSEAETAELPTRELIIRPPTPPATPTGTPPRTPSPPPIPHPEMLVLEFAGLDFVNDSANFIDLGAAAQGGAGAPDTDATLPGASAALVPLYPGAAGVGSEPAPPFLGNVSESSSDEDYT